jgi:molybdate transport system regulatory protein
MAGSRYHCHMSKNLLPLAEVLGHEASDKRIDILQRIGQVGSISEAARGAGVSYKAAWQALETLTNLAGTPLVDKAVGGSGGGGAVLTAAGQQVLQAAQAMAEARRQVIDQLAQWNTGSDAPGRAVLALRTSMRNQFPCTVHAVEKLGGQARVALRLVNGPILHARITSVSAQLLGLKTGLEVLAMCKATAMQVLPETTLGTAGNAVMGTVRRASRSADSEVTVQLANDIQLVGFAASGFKPKSGQTALAVFDESSLVIGALN